MENNINNIIIDDILSLIIQYSENYYCILVCKKWYNIIIPNSSKCSKCNKIIQMYNTILWISDNDITNNTYIIKGAYIKGKYISECEFYDIVVPRLDNLCNNATILIDNICHGYYGNFKTYRTHKEILSRNYNYLRNIKRQSTGLCLFAIRIDKNAIIHVRNLTEEICLQFIKFYYPDLECTFSNAKTKIEDYYVECVTKHGPHLEYIHNQTGKICLNAVMAHKCDGQCILKYVKEEHKTYAVQLEAVKKHSKSLKYIKNKTEEICLEAVKYYREAIKYVPDNNKTENICLEAIKYNGLLLQWVPEQYQTEKICLEAVTHLSSSFIYVSKNYQSENICLIAVKSHGLFLEYILDNNKTENICLEAVKNNGLALQFVPKKYHTENIYLEAVKRDGLAIQYIDGCDQEVNICLEAVKQNGLALEYIYEGNQEEEICLEAVNQNGLALQYVCRKYKTNTILFEAVKKNGMALRYVPEKQKIEEICLEAVKNDGNAIRYIPKHILTEVICLEAVKENGGAIEAIYTNNVQSLTYNICLEAVKNHKNNFAMDYVPKQYLTNEMYFEAVKNNSDYIKNVPPKNRTEEMILYILDNRNCDYRIINPSEEFCLEAYRLDKNYATYFG